jgi:CRISPR-associated protein Cmr4
MTTFVFLIRTLTNLHVGGGDSGGTGVVDKLVQRDPTTNLPTIHASSIKGALREYFEGAKIPELDITQVFGSSPKDRDADKIKPASHRFFAADLLALPVPQDAAPHFCLFGSQDSATKTQERLKSLGANVCLNLIKLKASDNQAKFVEAAEELPVIARNFLDNGISKNLWYEEIVPRESLFVTCIQGDIESPLAKELNEKVIQIGGNATVGYGFCLFTKLPPKTTPAS